MSYLFGYRKRLFRLATRGKKLKYRVRDLGHREGRGDPVATMMHQRWVIPGVAPLICDPWSKDSLALAVHERLCTQLPTPTIPRFYQRLRSYCRLFIRRHFTPVPRSSYTEKPDLFQWWLDRSTYTQTRKKQLYELWVNTRHRVLQVKDFICKAFVKLESYEKPKFPRAIVSRSDAYKCFSGPWFALIETMAYASPFFIKHVPVAERGSVVQRLAAAGTKILSSDFSSFELHANARVQRCVELQFYAYMLREIPEAALFLKTHAQVATKDQVLYGKHHRFVIPACRMSGETCTSLGNGITNLILVNFVTHVFGGQVVDGLVEGDDGLYAISGHIPTQQEFREAGCDVKLEQHEDLNTAGFCSMFFVDVDGQRIMMRDFREKLVKFGWTTSALRFGSPEVLLQLLRGSATALACELGSCPVLWIVAREVLSMTVGMKPIIDNDGFHWYTSAVSLRAPPIAARMAYERLFNVSVADQLALEQEIVQFGLSGPLLRSYCLTSERATMWSLVRERKRGMPVALARDRDY